MTSGARGEAVRGGFRGRSEAHGRETELGQMQDRSQTEHPSHNPANIGAVDAGFAPPSALSLHSRKDQSPVIISDADSDRAPPPDPPLSRVPPPISWNPSRSNRRA